MPMPPIPLRFPWDSEPTPGTLSTAPATRPEAKPAPKRRGRRPAPAGQAIPVQLSLPAGPAAAIADATSMETASAPNQAGQGARNASVGPSRGDWLYHHLTIRGPAEAVVEFAAVARGAGVTPWHLDGATLEEDVFHLAVAQPAARRSLAVTGCRILARQFRDRIETRQARAAALVGDSQACPFDLQTLLPVPADILQLGATHPTAMAWLAEHWGITDRLRQVVERPMPRSSPRLPAGHSVISYGFFTSGETPHAAITHIGERWPVLQVELRPLSAS